MSKEIDKRLPLGTSIMFLNMRQSFKYSMLIIYDSRVILDVKYLVRYDSKVVNYNGKAFIKLATFR